VALFDELFAVLFDVLFEKIARFFVSSPQATTNEKDNRTARYGTSFIDDVMRYT